MRSLTVFFQMLLPFLAQFSLPWSLKIAPQPDCSTSVHSQGSQRPISKSPSIRHLHPSFLWGLSPDRRTPRVKTYVTSLSINPSSNSVSIFAPSSPLASHQAWLLLIATCYLGSLPSLPFSRATRYTFYCRTSGFIAPRNWPFGHATCYMLHGFATPLRPLGLLHATFRIRFATTHEY